jgi:membrane protein
VRMRFTHILLGCLATAVLLAVIGPVFTAVIRFDPNYGFMFGSLKAVFLLLIWIYCAFSAILFGIEVSANIHRGDALLVRELLAPSAKTNARVLRLARFVDAYDAGQVIFREGETGETMFYIVSGAVIFSRKGQTLGIRRAHEYFGEMALLLKTERTATVTALEPDTRLVSISSANVETVFRENPKIVLSLLREMAERLRETNELVAKG